MKLSTTLLLGIMGAGFFSPQLVQADGKGSSKKESVVYERKTRLDFEEKTVDGQFATPEGMAVKGEKTLEFDSLLAPKKHFKKELKRDSGAVR